MGCLDAPRMVLARMDVVTVANNCMAATCTDILFVRSCSRAGIGTHKNWQKKDIQVRLSKGIVADDERQDSQAVGEKWSLRVLEASSSGASCSGMLSCKME